MFRRVITIVFEISLFTEQQQEERSQHKQLTRRVMLRDSKNLTRQNEIQTACQNKIQVLSHRPSPVRVRILTEP